MDVPVNLKNQLNTFKSKMSSLKSDCQALIQKYDSIREDIGGNALEEASLELAAAFTINSLFWIYLTCKGLDTKNHDLKLEINRIKLANIRLKKLKDKSKAPKLDVPAAQRFIKHSLFDPKSENVTRGADVPIDVASASDDDDDDNKMRKRKRIEENKKMEQDGDDNEEDEDEVDDDYGYDANVDREKTSLDKRNKDGLNVQKRGGGSKREERPSNNDHKGKRKANFGNKMQRRAKARKHAKRN